MDRPDPGRPVLGVAAAREHEKGKGHDGEAAKLHHGAAENEGNAFPAENGFVGGS